MNDELLKCHVRITFSGLTDEQREYLWAAEEALGKAGISFDRGGLVGCNGSRDWEFDWSLSPNVSVYLKPDNKSN